MLGGEELGVDLVESCEVAGIVEEHVDADDVFKGIPGGFEHLLEVFEGDAGLHGDVAGDDFDRAGEASAGLKRLLQKIGVPADIIRRIAIGTYEAEMNVIIHAGGGQVDAEIFPEETVVYIADQGPGIPDIKLAMQEGWSTAPDHVRQMGFGAGMGLPNMMKCSDDFDIQSTVGSGTNIKMKFKHISEDL